jgi:hypothetical protein
VVASSAVFGHLLALMWWAPAAEGQALRRRAEAKAQVEQSHHESNRNKNNNFNKLAGTNKSGTASSASAAGKPEITGVGSRNGKLQRGAVLVDGGPQERNGRGVRVFVCLAPASGQPRGRGKVVERQFDKARADSAVWRAAITGFAVGENLAVSGVSCRRARCAGDAYGEQINN